MSPLLSPSITKTTISQIPRTITTRALAADCVANPHFEVHRSITMPIPTHTPRALATKRIASPKSNWRALTVPSPNLIIRSVRSRNLTILSLPPRGLATPYEHYRKLSTQAVTLLAPEKEEPSPITQACHKLSQFMFYSTFLFHKLPASQIPNGWFNDPRELEKALLVPIHECGLGFKVSMPVLVRMEDEVMVWYLFEAGFKYYFYSGVSSSVHEITEAMSLSRILEKIKESGVGSLTTLVVGRILGEELECGGLVVAG